MKRTAILLTAGLLLGSMPVLPVFGSTSSAVHASDSEGKCGDQVYWKVNAATGELTVSGTGAMWDMLPEWPSDIKTAVIENGITRIGDNSFRSCTKLQSVRIPDSVTSAGSRAFYQCTSLADITIPAGLTDFEGEVFLDTAWLNARIEENPVVVVNNILIHGQSCGEEAVIPDGVTAIAPDSFKNNRDIRRVIMPDSLKKIGSLAFFYCTALESAELPAHVKEIGASAFNGCTRLMFQNGMPEDLETIGGEAFQYTAWLTAMREADPLVISNGVLVDARTAKGDVVLPDGVKTICSNAFYQNAEITSLVVPEGVTVFGNNAMQHCTSLRSVTLPDSLRTIEYGIFWGCTALTEINIPEGVTFIGSSLFNGCTGLTEITLPATLQEIGHSVFSDCTNLEKVTFLNPDTVFPDIQFFAEKKTVLEGYDNSTVQAYAERYGYTFASLGAAPGQHPVKGDFDGNGAVDTIDAQLVLLTYLDMITGNETSMNAAQFEAADVDGDEELTALDAQYILVYYLYNEVIEEPTDWDDIIS